jgi:hypothetical protein
VTIIKVIAIRVIAIKIKLKDFKDILRVIAIRVKLKDFKDIFYTC